MMTDRSSGTTNHEDRRLSTNAAIGMLKDLLGSEFQEFAEHYANADHELFAALLDEIAADLKAGGNGGVY